MTQTMRDNTVTNPAFKERFEAETRELLLSRTQYLLIIASFLYLSFFGLDWVTAPQHAFTFFCIRLFVIANYIGGILLLRSRVGLRMGLYVSVWVTYVSVLGVAVMTTNLSGFESVYYIGIIFILFIPGLFLPWGVYPTIVCGILSMATYFGLNFATGYKPSITLANTMGPFFFMGGSVVFTTFANIEKEKSRRRDLRLRMQVEKANEDLKELDSAKMRFFSNVSHELRTPLTLILGPLEAMLQGQERMNTQTLLKAMQANAHRLLRQVNTLLDFAKVDAGKLDLNLAYGNLGSLLKELVHAATPHARHRNIELSVEGAETLPDTILDLEKVETIAANLLSNAIKFTPDAGRITVRTGTHEDRILFEIEDSGIGIPEDQIESIFERFLQVDDTLARRNEGTGLGLAMVKELTRLHSGTISVRSRKGKGSTFRVELPSKPEMKPLERRKIIGRRRIDQLANERTVSMLGVAYETQPASGANTLLADVAGGVLTENAKAPQPLDQVAAPDAPKVMVVEDNPDLRTFIAGNLAGEYRIETAENGFLALEAARRWVPDLIISDIMMPKMDGYELCRKIRQDASLSDIPIILATSKSGGEAVVTGLDVGANDYVTKPFEMRELKARVAAQLRARRLERKLNERESRLAAIGHMTSSIVHDLKNPLNAIVGFSQIVQQDAMISGNEEIIKNLDPVINESKRLNRMIAEVLDFARGYAPNLNLESTSLISYLESICIPLKTKLETVGISLVLKHESADDIQIDLDSDRMHRIVENLIKNAQEALCSAGNDPKGKHIWITTRADERSAMIRIADDGPGIPEEVIETLFEPFTSTGKKTGTGLGLATVRNLVKAHDGDISVKTGGREGGAIFTMEFPLKSAPA